MTKFLTPADVPAEVVCRSIQIPNSLAWLGIFNKALLATTYAYNWSDDVEGNMTREEAAEAARVIVWQFLDQAFGCGSTDVPTPYWDEVSDVDDEAPADDQVWYGEVTDPEAPADDLTWQENVSIWLIDAFLIYSGDIGAAIYFNTIAPRFVLAWRKGDLREIWRVVVDAADVGTIDTDDFGAEDVIEMVVAADPENETHDVYIIKMDVP